MTQPAKVARRSCKRNGSGIVPRSSASRASVVSQVVETYGRENGQDGLAENCGSTRLPTKGKESETRDLIDEFESSLSAILGVEVAQLLAKPVD